MGDGPHKTGFIKVCGILHTSPKSVLLVWMLVCGHVDATTHLYIFASAHTHVFVPLKVALSGWKIDLKFSNQKAVSSKICWVKDTPVLRWQRSWAYNVNILVPKGPTTNELIGQSREGPGHRGGWGWGPGAKGTRKLHGTLPFSLGSCPPMHSWCF